MLNARVLGGKKTKQPDIEMGNMGHSQARPSSPIAGPSNSKPAADPKCEHCGHTNVEQKKLDIEAQKLDMERTKQNDLNRQNSIANAETAKKNKNDNFNQKCGIVAACLAAAGTGALAISRYTQRDVIDAEGWRIPPQYQKVLKRNYVDAEYFDQM